MLTYFNFKLNHCLLTPFTVFTLLFVMYLFFLFTFDDREITFVLDRIRFLVFFWMSMYEQFKDVPLVLFIGTLVVLVFCRRLSLGRLFVLLLFCHYFYYVVSCVKKSFG